MFKTIPLLPTKSDPSQIAKMANLFNNDKKNNTDSLTEGATGVAKTGTGSKFIKQAGPTVVKTGFFQSYLEQKLR